MSTKQISGKIVLANEGEKSSLYTITGLNDSGKAETQQFSLGNKLKDKLDLSKKYLAKFIFVKKGDQWGETDEQVYKKDHWRLDGIPALSDSSIELAFLAAAKVAGEAQASFIGSTIQSQQVHPF